MSLSKLVLTLLCIILISIIFTFLLLNMKLGNKGHEIDSINVTNLKLLREMILEKYRKGYSITEILYLYHSAKYWYERGNMTKVREILCLINEIINQEVVKRR